MTTTAVKATRILLAAACAGLLPVAARAQSVDLRGFAKSAAIGGMAEVEMGRVAVRNASRPRVKEFGQRMVDDHSKAGAALKVAAGQVGIELPSGLDAEHRRMVDKLAGMSGTAFDRAYIGDMVDDHEKDVAEFEKAAKQPGDSPVKKFAQDTLPTLRDHLRMAREVQKEVKGARP